MTELFIHGLSYAATSGDLREAFASAGQVERTHIVRDRATQESRGFGFVRMATQAETQRAIELLNGSTLDGRRIHVRLSEPREARA